MQKAGKKKLQSLLSSAARANKSRAMKAKLKRIAEFFRAIFCWPVGFKWPIVITHELKVKRLITGMIGSGGRKGIRPVR